MRNRSRVLVVLGLLGVALAEVGGAPAVDAAVEPTLGPLISGTTSILEGTHVWTDYAYDDRGTAPSEPPKAGNAADLIQLQLRPTADGLAVRAVLETLTDPAAPAVGIGLDLDATPGTGAAGPPAGGWQVGGTQLGLERSIVLTAGRAEVLGWEGGAWVPVGSGPAAADPEANTVDAVIGWELLPDLGPRWRVAGWVGLVGGPIHDLAYVEDRSSAEFQSGAQAAVLRGAADAATAVVTVDLGEVATTTRLAAPEPGRKHTFLYRSALRLGEGLGPALSDRQYPGPYQPYAVWFPADLPPSPPLVVFLHGAMSSHLSGSYGGDESFIPGLPFGPGQIAPRAVVVTPLARAEASLGMDGASEQDVLDVVADVSRRFAVDEDRVVLTGYSLGGVGTFRLAQLHPDRWAGAIEIVGADDLGAISALDELGGTQRLPNALENLRNLPFRMAHARADELELLIGGVQPDRAALELHQLGYDLRYWSFLAREHLSFPVAAVQCEIESAIERGRVVDPARVTYSRNPAIPTDDEAIGLHLEHGSAYWVSDLVPRGADFAPGEDAGVDVTSLARPDRVPALQTIVGVTASLGGLDVCGGAADVEGVDAWTTFGQAWLPGQPQPTSNGFEAAVTRVESFALDVARMGLDPALPIAATISTDGPVRIELVCPAGTTAVEVDGGRAARSVHCP